MIVVTSVSLSLLCFIVGGGAAVDESDVRYFLYTDTENATQLTDVDAVDATTPLAFIIHGWRTTANTSWVVQLAEALVESKDYSVITVDWSDLSYLLYTQSVSDVPAIGDLVGQVIVDIYYNDYGANLSSIELIGHSLGAHIAGFGGNYIQSTLNQSVGKIVGLDPAGPLYQFQEEDERLSPDDADLVVAIHSDAGAFGYVGSCADIDFFPNGATPPQPGCIEQLFVYLAQTLSCSHERSHEFYLEAVKNSDGFVSTDCGSYLLYALDKCDSNRTVTIGGDLTIEDAGNYYLYTNSESPYSKE